MHTTYNSKENEEKLQNAIKKFGDFTNDDFTFVSHLPCLHEIFRSLYLNTKNNLYYVLSEEWTGEPYYVALHLYDKNLNY